MMQAREAVVLDGMIVDEVLAAKNEGEAEMKQSWA
jgi:hypothetical protein